MFMIRLSCLLWQLLCSANSSRYVQNIKYHPFLNLGDLRLRVVEMIRFERLTADIEFQEYLLESAMLVDKIVIDPCRPHYLGSRKELFYRNSKEYESARKRAVMLAAKLPELEYVTI